MAIRYSLQNFQELNKQFDSRMIRQAQFAAINKTLPKLRTHVSRRLRERFNVTARAITERVQLRKAAMSTGLLQGIIVFKGRRIGLINFSAQAKRVTIARAPRGKNKKGIPFGRFRTGVTVRVHKAGGRKLVTDRKGFIAKGKNGSEHIFYRQTKRRFWGGPAVKEVLRAAYQYSIAEMVTQANGAVGTKNSYTDFIKEEYDKEFDAALNYYMNAGPSPQPSSNV